MTKLGLQKVDPIPLHKYRNIKKGKMVICSPLKRVILSMPNNINYITDDSLKEVLFDLSKFTSAQEFSSNGSVLIRRKFKEFFIKDELPEKRNQIFRKIRILLEKLQKIKEEEVVIVSHSFKLKLIEAYIKTRGRIEYEPELIRKFIKDNKKTFQFEKGFSVKL